MNERVIELENIAPKEFWGAHDKHLETIKKYYPKLKIVARGTTLKAFGEEDVLDEFELRFRRLMLHFTRFNSIDDNVIMRIIEGDVQPNNQMSDHDKILVHGVGGKLIKAMTPNQQLLVDTLQKNDMVFAVGPAGTGKTYTGVALAVRALKEKQVKRIILTRPAVEAGENLGFLPGDMKEKLDPYMQPLYDALRDMIPPQTLEDYIMKGVIQIAPLAFMRGRTLDNAFVILDEAQNTTHSQMKMFLTRMGRNAKFIITGDPGQVDLPRRTISGLKEALLVLKNVDGIGIIYLDDKDIVRHKLVKKIIDAYKSIENQD
ncbi:PhoH family protein [Flavobacterium columnare]|uniref:PhoH-like protein n=1 Tax=Flavobacterium columnare (strain ATCC 49512 / CIP 103533 / TG 44/87) TaxID=1041826 RepID=G8X716_FLACA|nr:MULTISPECIES: PhoH family protein [Flavobacterium]AEW86377.1 putative phosphate starvation-inducible PhoH-like protein [Flavobacterium columnare ATCC 49512]AND64696.1 phosphate starvation-inducible protein PhoH [Flavobacterium covae]ANO48279.1 putative phosphate starvation-inducible PhoH-like protein [Flavobacterium columnare]MBF6653690.1 PhoH family protein [Flavobacterium columnare]MBF6656531.1 PhoH family protein [Flavobacterium columnare]